MKRRAKLNLDPDAQAAKSRPAGFDKGRSGDSSDQTEPTDHRSGIDAKAGVEGDKPAAAHGASVWPDGRKLLAALLVAAAAGLTLYLFKRRLF